MISIIYSDKFLLHKTSDNHPERPERLRAIIEALGQQTDNLPLNWVEPNSRDLRNYLNRFHSSKYIQKVEDMANNGGGNFYEDTFVSPDSFNVALLAVSAWMDGINLTLKNCKGSNISGLIESRISSPLGRRLSKFDLTHIAHPNCHISTKQGLSTINYQLSTVLTHSFRLKIT